MFSYSQRARAVFPGLLAAVLSVHFGLTLAYVLPLNPITLRLAPVVNGYLTPFFAQDWRLFAPDPISETRMLLLSCRLRSAQGTAVETAWVDISTPLWTAQARQRFSPAGWLLRPQTDAIQRFFTPNELLIRLERPRLTATPSVSQLADTLRTAERARRVLARRVLARLGSAYCDRWYGAGLTVATRVRLATLRFPRFSQRQWPDTAGDVRYSTFEWLPYERVAPLTGSDT